MAVLCYDCHSCNRNNTGFTSFAQIPMLYGEIAKRNFLVSFSCNRCSAGLFVEVFVENKSEIESPHEFNGDIMICHFFKINEVYPKKAVKSIPPGVPENIAGFYQEAIKCFNVEAWSSVGFNCRKTMEMALKEKDLSSRNLHDKINKLASENIISNELAEWSHEIRDFGNDAVHDDIFTVKDATQAIGFTEIFLTYVYTMPAMLAERRKKNKT